MAFCSDGGALGSVGSTAHVGRRGTLEVASVGTIASEKAYCLLLRADVVSYHSSLTNHEVRLVGNRTSAADKFPGGGASGGRVVVIGG